MLKTIADAALIVLSFVLAYFFRFHVMFFLTPESLPILDQYLNILIFITLIWLALFKLVGLYDEKKFTSLIDELARLFLAVTLASLVLLGLLFLYRELWFSRLVILNAWVIAFVLLSLLRLAVFLVIRFLRLNGFGLRNVLIVGAGEMGQALALKIKQDKALGYVLAGALTSTSLPEIKDIIIAKRIQEIIIADVNIGVDKILDIITECERFGVEFKLVPGILELIATRLDVDELAGIPLLTVSEIQLKGFKALAKRWADIIMSLISIIIFSPVFMLFPILIKLSSPGPVFYVQPRIGRDQKAFNMLKFRSMVKEAEKMLPQLEALSETEGHIFKIKADPRMTPLGRFMRHWSIDELPQLFNVFFGQMSMVGPRPPLPREVEKYSNWHKKRLRVRPGITGPWQVSGRSLLPFEDMVRLDIFYIENWSLWLDFKILMRTIPVVLFGYGAY